MPELDLTVDGADEIDPKLRLIKGGGGALLREKIVAAASARMAVIADASKLVQRLGAFPLPVEVVPFGLTATRRHIEAALSQPRSRRSSPPPRRYDALRHRRPTLHPRPFCGRDPGPRGPRRGAVADSRRRRTRIVHRLRPGRLRRRRRGGRDAWPDLNSHRSFSMLAKRTLTARILGCAVLAGPAAHAAELTPALRTPPPERPRRFPRRLHRRRSPPRISF